MLRQHVAVIIALAAGFGEASAQDAVKIDFGRDVQPLFKAHCTECHGPKQQKNGFRLDRRRDAMRGGTSADDRAWKQRREQALPQAHRGSARTANAARGPLESGANQHHQGMDRSGRNWPDDLAGETPTAPPDPGATGLMESLRQGDRHAFEAILRDDPKVAQPPRPRWFDTLDVRRALRERGFGSPSPGKPVPIPTSAMRQAPRLSMWAVDDVERCACCSKAGADANARSDDERTPLLIAAGWVGAWDVVKLLLDHGADPSVKAYAVRGGATPLRQAAAAGDEAVMLLLMERGAKVKGEGIAPLISAVNANGLQGVDLLIKAADREALNQALLSVVPPRGSSAALGNTRLVQKLLDHGADANAKDVDGHTVLMLAASSDRVPVETIQTLIDRGADVHATSAGGETVLDFAKWRGKSPLVDLLMKAGAKEGSASSPPAPKPKPAGSVRAALERSIPLLQRVDVTFLQKAGCVSCHNNSHTAATVAMARKTESRWTRVLPESRSRQLPPTPKSGASAGSRGLAVAERRRPTVPSWWEWPPKVTRPIRRPTPGPAI